MELVPDFPLEFQPVIAKALSFVNKILGNSQLVCDLLVPVAELFKDSPSDTIDLNYLQSAVLDARKFTVFLLSEAEFLEKTDGHHADMCIIERCEVYVNINVMPHGIDQYSIKSGVLFVLVVFLHEVLGHGCTHILNKTVRNENFRMGVDATPEKVGRVKTEQDGVVYEGPDAGFGFEYVHLGGFLTNLAGYNTIANTTIKDLTLPLSDENRNYRIVGKAEATAVFDALDRWDGVSSLSADVFAPIRYDNLPEILVGSAEFSELVKDVEGSIKARFRKKGVQSFEQEARAGMYRRTGLNSVRQNLKI